MFWRDDSAACDVADVKVEAVDGYSVDGCFTLPGEEQPEQPAEVLDAQSLGTERPESS